MTSKDDVPENGQEHVAGQRETVVGDTTKRVSNSSFKGQGFNKGARDSARDAEILTVNPRRWEPTRLVLATDVWLHAEL
jgi:hypothetical protein